MFENDELLADIKKNTTIELNDKTLRQTIKMMGKIEGLNLKNGLYNVFVFGVGY